MTSRMKLKILITFKFSLFWYLSNQILLKGSLQLQFQFFNSLLKSTDHEALTNIKTEFMALWDGFTTDQHARVMVLAATNRPSELDEAILRCLPLAFEIGFPDRKERVSILKVILKDEKVEDGIDYDRIASFCKGYTGSDLLDICKKAAYFPIRDLLNDEKTGKQSQAWQSSATSSSSSAPTADLSSVARSTPRGRSLSPPGKEIGVTDFIDPQSNGDRRLSEIIKELTGGGADYCFECVGMASLVEEAFASSRKGWGKTVVLGVDKPGPLLTLGSFDVL